MSLYLFLVFVAVVNGHLDGNIFNVNADGDLSEATVGSIIANLSKIDTGIYIYSVAQDIRTDFSVPPGLNHDVSKHLIGYDGRLWYDLGAPDLYIKRPEPCTLTLGEQRRDIVDTRILITDMTLPKYEEDGRVKFYSFFREEMRLVLYCSHIPDLKIEGFVYSLYIEIGTCLKKYELFIPNNGIVSFKEFLNRFREANPPAYRYYLEARY